MSALMPRVRRRVAPQKGQARAGESKTSSGRPDARGMVMVDRRIIGAGVQERLRRARRIVRLLSLLLVSVIGLGMAQPGSDATLEDEADRDERVVFRHFV